MSDAIIALFITFLSFGKTVHQCILHSAQSNCCRAKLSTSCLLTYGPVTDQSLSALTTRLRDLYINMSMSNKTG